MTLSRPIVLVFATVSLAGCGGNEKAAEDTATVASTTAPETTQAPASSAGGPAASPSAPAPSDTATTDGTELASFDGDATAGEKAFAACRTCHVVVPGQNRIGPSLHGIVGRTAGSIEGYKYTAANKNSGIIWTEEKLFQYLEKPQRVIPGTKMAYAGQRDVKTRADLIAYLKAQA